MPTTHSGFMIQSSFGTRGNFELVVSSSTGGGFAHAFRDNDPSPAVWGWSTASPIFRTDATAPFPSESTIEVQGAMSLIQSDFGAPGNLATVALVLYTPPRPLSGPIVGVPAYSLALYWRDATGTWGSNYFLDGGDIYNPIFRPDSGLTLIQSRFGNKGNFEVVVPLARGGLVHFYCDNDDPNTPWIRLKDFGEHLGRVSAVALLQSNYGSPGNLELIARVGNQLAHFWRVGPSDPWLSDPAQEFFFSGTDGVPGFIQSKYGIQGNFEVVTPLETGGMAHLYRNNDELTTPWTRTGVFGADIGRVSAVALVQSNFGSPGNLEVVARSGNNLFHFYRDQSLQWIGPTETVPIP